MHVWEPACVSEIASRLMQLPHLRRAHLEEVGKGIFNTRNYAVLSL